MVSKLLWRPIVHFCNIRSGSVADGSCSFMNDNAVAAEAKRIEEDATYSSKSHFDAASAWSHAYYWIGIPIAILSAIAGASALSKFEYHSEIAGILSILIAILSSVNVFLNPQQKASAHRRAALSIWEASRCGRSRISIRSRRSPLPRTQNSSTLNLPTTCRRYTNRYRPS